ncbi:MAG: lysophospholipid acyltransferase family protein [Gemmatimonadota bacterium]|nr:lysophospholipid acyltransferase family protein [Gemmatimonadota bacterium]
MKRALGWIGHGFVRALARTWRIEAVGEEHITAARASGSPVLFAVWHGQLLVPLWHRRRQPITLLVSAHGDGKLLARAAERWGYGIAYGSSTRGGSAGLRRLVRVLQAGGDGAVTPDGPRGPARVAKAGVLAAARGTGASIIPVAAAATSAWRVRSWDGFMVPRPFARVRVVYGAPLAVPRTGDPGGGRDGLERAIGDAEIEARCIA